MEPSSTYPFGLAQLVQFRRVYSSLIPQIKSPFMVRVSLIISFPEFQLALQSLGVMSLQGSCQAPLGEENPAADHKSQGKGFEVSIWPCQFSNTTSSWILCPCLLHTCWETPLSPHEIVTIYIILLAYLSPHL